MLVVSGVISHSVASWVPNLSVHPSQVLVLCVGERPASHWFLLDPEFRRKEAGACGLENSSGMLQ